MKKPEAHQEHGASDYSILRLATALVRPLLIPMWIAQLLGSTKSFEYNRLINSRSLNYYGLHTGRVRLAHTLARWRRSRLHNSLSEADRATFDIDGFVVKPKFLEQKEFLRLLEEVSSLRGMREMVQGSTITRRVGLDPAVLASLPALSRLLDNAMFRGLLHYAGTYRSEPVICIQTILARAVIGAEDPQCDLHADTFHPTVKAWLFLTDVASDQGPFTYVPGSHRLTSERLAWEHRMSMAAVRSEDRMTRQGSFRVNDDDLLEMGLPSPIKIAVSANTLVVADTHGFHARAESTRPTRRVEIWAYGRRSPFIPWLGYDPWNIRSLGLRRMPLFWWLGDVLETLGAGRNSWQLRSNVSPFDETAAGPRERRRMLSHRL